MSDLRNIFELSAKLSKKKTIKILDLGSGDVSMKIKYLLTSNRNKFKYYPVDSKTECSFYRDELDYENQCTEKINKADWIKKINNSLRYDEGFEFKPIDEIEFNEMFNLNFNKDAIQFCNEILYKVKFDVILLSNMLHFLKREKADELFRMCTVMLSKNGLIQIVVLNDYQTEYKRKNLYNEEDFNKLKTEFKIINEDNNSLHYEFLEKKK